MEQMMKNAALFAFALLIAGATMAQPTYAAGSAEPGAAASEPMKAKPAKHKHHGQKHEHHTHNMKAHKTTKAV